MYGLQWFWQDTKAVMQYREEKKREFDMSQAKAPIPLYESYWSYLKSGDTYYGGGSK